MKGHQNVACHCQDANIVVEYVDDEAQILS